MAKKKQLQDTTVVQPRYKMFPSDEKSIRATKDYSGMVGLNQQDTTKQKNIQNVKSDQSLLKRNAERVLKEKKAPLPKPAPTKTAKDLPKKKK